MSDPYIAFWPDLVLDPKRLGSDLRLSLLKRQGPTPFTLQPEGSNVMYTFFQLEKREDRTFNATVMLSFGRKNIDEVVDPREYGEWFAAQEWPAGSGASLDRKVYMRGKVQKAHSADFDHVHSNLCKAIVNFHAFNTENGENTLGQKVAYMLSTIYSINALADKPLAVCAGCNFHSDKPMKRCPCSRDVKYCSRRCQKAHWVAGHRAEHHDD
jgi:hypothetical protein